MSASVGIVIDTWKHLRVHAESCLVCAPSVAILARVPDDPAPHYDALCDEGQRLFAEWDAAKRELARDSGPVDRLLERIRETRRMFELEGLSQEMADRRNRALDAAPDGEVGRLRQLPHAERMGIVQALEAAQDRREANAEIRAGASSRARPPAARNGRQPRTCAVCGNEFEGSGGRYCSRKCREDDTPALFGTEE